MPEVTSVIDTKENTKTKKNLKKIKNVLLENRLFGTIGRHFVLENSF